MEVKCDNCQIANDSTVCRFAGSTSLDCTADTRCEYPINNAPYFKLVYITAFEWQPFFMEVECEPVFLQFLPKPVKYAIRLHWLASFPGLAFFVTCGTKSGVAFLPPG